MSAAIATDLRRLAGQLLMTGIPGTELDAATAQWLQASGVRAVCLHAANLRDTAQLTRLINAGSVSTEGVELDYALQATRQLKLSGALAYTHARIDQFDCPAGAAASCNVDGQPLPYTPD
ncbi:MAG: hypothetical protein I8H69_19575, partial [Burkholderiales bacterium]|nr:hypothetical protein [Burkholderiales bacterium]